MWNARKSGKNELRSINSAGQSATRRQIARIWMERLLFVAGLGLLVVYGAARIESFLSSRNAMKRFEALRSSAAFASANRNSGEGGSVEETGFSKLVKDIGSSEVDFSQWDEHRIQAFNESRANQFNAPLGVLRIAKIHLEVPLLDGTDDLTLNHAVGRIAGTAKPGERGNIGIAGHRDGFFRGLKDVRTGDEVELETQSGTETYIVGETTIVSPSDTDVLRPRSVPSLTLVTCYPFYFIGSAPQRYIITAFLSLETKSGSGKSDTPSVISNVQFKKEKQ